LVAVRRRHLVLLLVTVAVAGGCAREEKTPAAPTHAEALERLRAFETTRRGETDFARLPGSNHVMGPDPAAVRRVPGTPYLVGLLRNRSAIVLLDGDAHEIERLHAPAGATGLAVTPEADIFVTGDLEPEIARYAVEGGRLRRTSTLPLENTRAVRDVAAGREGVVYAVEDHGHRILTLNRLGALLDATPVGLGPRFVMRTPQYILVDCILSHEIVVMPVDARGIPRVADAIRIAQNGPLWSMDAVETGDGLLLALGGIEDHPLDRRQGSFGYIDSFAYVYRLAPSPKRVAAVNVSALGVVTPKVTRLTIDGTRVTLHTTGYGDVNVADLTWDDPQPGADGLWPEPKVATRALVPGTASEAALDGGRAILADPLLDAWVVDDGTAARVVPVPDPAAPARSVASRVGEALVFTTLIAPWNRTDGSVSRFTCEACHFEGRADGRIHDTGRDDVKVTTRTLFGLFNNRPHFSRALDPDLTSVAHNEFRVAGLRSRHDPWFDVQRSEMPWVAHLGVDRDLPAEELRRDLMTFLMEFTHRPNPAVLGRAAWTPDEARGAEVFRDRCEGCHQARLVTDEADTRMAFERWERLVMSPEGPIVWARETYEKTGVEPYVNEKGARVPSLRRLYLKHPYFTSGAAKDLDDLLLRMRYSETTFHHDGGQGNSLDDASRVALRAFLDLL
jgi:hypothetical protein